MGKTKYPTPFGEGSVYKVDGKDNWEGIVSLGKDENGKQIRKHVTAATPEEVKHKLDTIRIGIETGAIPTPSNITVREIYYSDLELLYSMNSIGKSAYQRHIYEASSLNPIIDMPIQKIDYHVIKRYFDSITCFSHSEIKKRYYDLNKTFESACRKGIITFNPMKGFELPKGQPAKKKRALSIDEQKQFLDATNQSKSKYIPQMLIAVHTGLRCGEINALTPDDINFRYGFISVNKTITAPFHSSVMINDSPKTSSGNRQVPITDILRPVLEEAVYNCHGDRTRQLFLRKDGGLIHSCLCNHAFKSMLKSYDVLDNSIEGSVSFHSLRHTFATRCIEGGMPLLTLKNIMGHSTIDMTLDVYSDVFDKYERSNYFKVDNYLTSLGLEIGAKL